MFYIALLLIYPAFFAFLYGMMAIWEPVCEDDRKKGIIIAAIALPILVGSFWYVIWSLGPLEWPEELPEYSEFILGY